MLAGVYLSADRLGLSDDERQALIEVLEGLERGWFIHAQPGADLGYNIGLAFNMGRWDCGTTACIAGWCDLLYKTRFVTRVKYDCAFSGPKKYLADLFLATGVRRSLEDITIKQTAMALRNYLSLGKPFWREVMKKPKRTRARRTSNGQADDQGTQGVAEQLFCPAGQGRGTERQGRRKLPDSGPVSRRQRAVSRKPAREFV